MSAQESMSEQPSGQDIAKALTEIQGQIKTGFEMVDKKTESIIKAVNVIKDTAQGVDAKKVDEALMVKEGESEGEGESKEGPPGAMGAMGAAGKQPTATNKVTSHKTVNARLEAELAEAKEELKEFREVKAKFEAQQQEIMMERRKMTATKIVDKLIKLGSLEEGKRDERIDYYLNLKRDGSEDLVDLSLYAEEMDALQVKTVGASGLWTLPTMNDDKAGKASDVDMLRGMNLV